jgi:hypothetical protein
MPDRGVLMIRDLLSRIGWSERRAAARLGVPAGTFYRYVSGSAAAPEWIVAYLTEVAAAVAAVPMQRPRPDQPEVGPRAVA